MYQCCFTCRMLDALYPHTPNEKELSQLVQSNLGNKDLTLIRTFLHNLEFLKLSRHLLPPLISFYLWLHSHLPYQVTRQRASEINIMQVISVVAKNLSDDTGKYLKHTFEEIKGLLTADMSPIMLPLWNVLIISPWIQFTSMNTFICAKFPSPMKKKLQDWDRLMMKHHCCVSFQTQQMHSMRMTAFSLWSMAL